jgi:FeS assembly SUF system protein
MAVNRASKHQDPATMTDDIEHLKKHKLEPSREDGRVHLPTAGGHAPAGHPPFLDPEEVTTEAFGGTGQRPPGPIDLELLRQRIVDTLKSVYDPEIPVNIYDLGLIYGIEASEDGRVEVEMTLTAPGCPVAGSLVREVAEKVGNVPGVATSHVQLVWEPPWTKERMSEEAMLELGLL